MGHPYIVEVYMVIIVKSLREKLRNLWTGLNQGQSFVEDVGMCRYIKQSQRMMPDFSITSWLL